MRQIVNLGNRYEGFNYTHQSGAAYRAPSFSRLTEKVRKFHPEINEADIEADWCRRNPGQCAELPDIPADASSRHLAYLSAVAPRSAARIGVLSFEDYEQGRRMFCVVCPHFGGERGIGLITCRKCKCTHLKAYGKATKCPDIPPRWKI